MIGLCEWQILKALDVILLQKNIYNIRERGEADRVAMDFLDLQSVSFRLCKDRSNLVWSPVLGVVF